MTKFHLYLIDGSGFIFRAFHALPPLTRSDGTPVNAVLGFTNMLAKFLDDNSIDRIAVVFDTARKTFRNDIYEAYKANRDEPPEELIPQFKLIREVCDAFNVQTIEMHGYEADDVIATYTKNALNEGGTVTVVSSDKDLMQLIKDGVIMLDPMKNKVIGPQEVFEKFGVAPEKVIDVQALAGDSSDNVPGVPGIGVKTAAELITTYGSLENLLKNTADIKQPKRREKLEENVENALISKKLVTLDENVPLNIPLSTLNSLAPDPAKLREFLQEQDFHSLIARLEKKGVLKEMEKAPVERKEHEYHLIDSFESLNKWIQAAQKQGHIVIDTETNSLDPLQANLVGISLCTQTGLACYIPVGHQTAQQDLLNRELTKVNQLPLNEVIAALKPMLEDPSIVKIGHNIKYDMLVLSQYGIEMSPIDDTMVMSYILDGGEHGHGMDELAKLFLDHDTIKYSDVVGKGKDQKTFDQITPENAVNYASEDADITLQLYEIFKPRLIKAQLSSVYETMDRPLITTLANMEKEGISLNPNALYELSQHLSTRLAELEKEIYALAGEEFNIGSPSQLGEILFEKLNLDSVRKGKSGKHSTDVKTMEKLIEGGHELPAKILDWRQLAKLKSTYTDSLPKQINPKTGRVHTSYSITNTLTGRLASSNPNLQNIPIRSSEGLKIREAFVARPGHKLISLDYSQIEIRILAHVANLEELRNALTQGIDIHAQVASEVFGVPLDQVDSKLRSRAKAINFGIIYGISAFGLSRQLNIARSDAGTYIKKYLQRYPGIEQYMEETREYARHHGYVKTLYGRICRMPGINDKNPSVRGGAERQATNAPLQGTAADIIKRAMIRIDPAFKKANLKAKMLLQVHDELIFEAPINEVEKTIEIAKEIMEQTSKLSVPLIVDVGIGNNWAETK